MNASTRKLRTAVVGCGRVAEFHLRHLSARTDVVVVAVADSNLDHATRLAAKHGVPNVYPSLEALLATQHPDVVHILTPPASHKDLALLAIEHGAHVLVEKPLSLNPEDARVMHARAAVKGVMLVPDFIQLFHPRMVEAIELINSGRLGRVLNCECDIGLDLNMPELREARGLHWSYQLPGGVLQNYITHPLYLVMRFTGAAKRIHVVARALGALPQGLTDSLDVLIDGERASGHMTVSLLAQPSPYVIRIICERGNIVVDFDSMMVLTTAAGGALPRALARILNGPRLGWQMMRWTFRNVWGALRKKLLPYHGLSILFDRVYTAAAAGGAPPVSPELSLAVSQAEQEILSRAGKLHVDVTNRSQRQATANRERVLVTGAAGYLGRAIVARLVREDYAVRAIVRPMSDIAELERLGVEIHFGDLRDCEAVLRAAEGVDVIAHVGAALRGSGDFMRESTVGGTQHVAEAARVRNVRRVVYISSMAVYDFAAVHNGHPITAESPLEASPAERGVASMVKREAEDIALEEARTHGWTILRPSLIFGGGRDALSMLGPKKGSRVICLGKPSARLRLVHVEDVAGAVSLLIRSPEAPGKVFTLSHPETLTYREYFRALPPTVTAGVRPFYLRRWFVSGAAFAVRALNRLRGRRGGMSARQVGYLYADVLVDSEPIRRIGWQPFAPLRDQVRSARDA